MPKTELDLDALEAVAKAATQGKWEADGEERIALGCRCLGCWERVAGVWCVSSADGVDLAAQADAEHIAAFDPPTALALIARVRELEQKLARERERAVELKKENERLHSRMTRAFLEAASANGDAKEMALRIEELESIIRGEQ